MRCPFAEWRPLDQNAYQTHINPFQVIFHSLTSTDIDSSWKYFNGSSAQGTEAHFLVGYDGHIIQAMDTNVRADANWDGNMHAIAIETASNHGATDTWTPAQLQSLVRLGKWILTSHSRVGHKVCRTWDDPGFGYHRQFDEWNHNKHSCPGNARVAQFPGLVKSIVALPAPPSEDEVMATADEVATAVWQSEIQRTGGNVRVKQEIANLTNSVASLTALVEKIAEKVGVTP